MLTITITQKDGSKTSLSFDKPEITIGRIKSNDIILQKGNISKRHALIVLEDSQYTLLDQRSTNGTYLNGELIDQPHRLNSGDEISIGDFVLAVERARKKSIDDETPLLSPPDEEANPEMDITHNSENEKKSGGKSRRKAAKRSDRPITMVHSGPLPQHSEALKAAAEEAPEEPPKKSKKHDWKKDRKSDDMAWEMEGPILDIMPSPFQDLPQAHSNIEENLPTGLPEIRFILTPLLTSDAVSEIFVNHARQVYIQRDGQVELTDLTFSNDEAVLEVIQHLLDPLGEQLDESSPMIDIRLEDGSRLTAILPPLAVNGPTFTIRKFSREVLNLHDLVVRGTINAGIAAFLELAVETNRNIIISGEKNSGITTTLNALTNLIPSHERLITIEEVVELQFNQGNIVQLESQPINPDHLKAYTLRDLVQSALRMRPDRIIIGECRGGETLDVLQAMATDHNGTLTTVHAPLAEDILPRLESMVLMTGEALPSHTLRSQIAGAVDLVIHQSLLPDGSRRITQISEILLGEDDTLSLQAIFLFAQDTPNDEGTFQATGVVPQFLEALPSKGLPGHPDLFQAPPVP